MPPELEFVDQLPPARNVVGGSWRDTGYAIAPQTPREVMQQIGGLGAYSTGQQFAWRGVSSADYIFTSSLQRDLLESTGKLSTEEEIRSAERQMLDDAREWGLGGGRNGQVDDLQLLAELQHFGSPTRLLDLTSNPMTALWFACEEPRAKGVGKSGLVVAINVRDWPTYPSISDLDWAGDPRTPIYARQFEKALEAETPFLVRALEANSRIAAQEGYFAASVTPAKARTWYPFAGLNVQFTIRDRRSPPLDFTRPRGQGQPVRLPFVAIIIKASLKAQLRTYLKTTFNRSARTLFPDFPGFRTFGTQFGSKEPEDATV